MRIETVELHDFRSHHTSLLDFRHSDAWMICGPTGGGKSSIPEAILWANTGWTSSEDNGFVRLGASGCQVICTERIGDQRYKIERTYTRKGDTGETDLQLFAWNGAKWMPAGGKGVRETQAIIQDTIRASLETLLMSSFSTQDDSHRFLKPPVIRINSKEYRGAQARIQVLSQLCGATEAEPLRIKAKAEADALDVQATTLETQVAGFQATAAEREGVVLALDDTRRQLTVVEQESTVLAAKRLALERTHAELQANAVTFDLSAFQADQAKFLILQTRIIALQRTAENYRKTLDAAETIRQQVTEYESVSADVKDAHLTLETLKTTLTHLVTDRRRSLEAVEVVTRAQVVVQDKLDGLRRQEDRLKTLQCEVESLGAMTVDLTSAKQTVTELTTQQHTLREQREACQNALHECQAALATLDAARGRRTMAVANLRIKIQEIQQRHVTVPCETVGDLASTCPLLASARSEQATLDTLQGELQSLESTVDDPTLRQRVDKIPSLSADSVRLQSEWSEATRLLIDATQNVKVMEARVAHYQRSAVDYAALQSTLQEIPALEVDLESRKHGVETAQIAARQAQEAQEGTESQVALLRGHLDTLVQKQGTLSSAQQGLQILALAETNLPNVESELARVQSDIDTLSTSIAEMGAKAADAAQCSERQTAITKEIQDVTKQCQDQELKVRALVASAATLEAKLSNIDCIVLRMDELSIQAKDLRRKHSELCLLHDGYKAIPVMIIENMAVPFLETETNRILNRITSNNMRVRFITQRVVKSRDSLVDGLDLKISDLVGERNYADYSGGQKFQINLAVRMALAKLNAHRTGALIETLVVDEGFGSQSPECFDQIVAALRLLQHEIPLLIVISHVEQLRETFPAVYTVTGGPHESHAIVG